MKIVRKELPLFAPLAIVLLGASCAIAQAKQETESKVTMKDLPAPVQAKVKELSKGAVMRGLSKEVENGQTFSVLCSSTSTGDISPQADQFLVIKYKAFISAI
jgi:hypothetical protein